MNPQKIKTIWEPKKMTQKICVGETLARPWDYQTCKKSRKALQDYDYLLYIAPIGRERGRIITANISVLHVPIPENEQVIPYYGNPDYVRFEYLVDGGVGSGGKSASFNMHNSFTVDEDDLNLYHDALEVFKYGVHRFREVFKEYLPA